MKLIQDAGRVWHRLWSVRLSLISAAFSAAQTCVDVMTSGQPRLVVVGAGLIAFGAAVSRLVQQTEVHPEADAKQ